MKLMKYIAIALLLTAVATNSANAKQVKAKQLYMFGFSASFTDSTVYMTSVQDVPGAWIDSKTKFLLGRDSYSYQLSEYLSEKRQQPKRVCLVIYALNRKKAEKQLQKMKRRYVEKAKGAYNVLYIKPEDFKFEAVEISPDQQ